MNRGTTTAPAGGPAALQLTVVGAAAFADLPARATLRRWIVRALERPAQIALVFVGTRAGRALNRDFRGRDYATNVLTFAYEGAIAAPGKAAPGAAIITADIVLCLPVVRREAREQGKSLRAHMAHLVIHGVLHAQGYDHERGREARRMQARETELLAQLRIADPYAGESA